MAKRTLVVVNPRSQGGAGRRRFVRHEGRLRDALGEVEVEWTRGPRDAERIAREGVRAGVERVVVAGGDGTVSEVVTGLLEAGLGGYAELAVVPLGTGADLLRTLGIPRDPEAAIAAIRDGKPRRVDAGRVRYRRPEGGEATAYFLNTASLGIVGLITALVIIGTVRGVLRYRQPTVRLRVDGELVHDGSLTFATAANGRYFGGGMYVAPDAEPDDGLLDFVLVSEFSRGKLLRHLPGFYRGTHVGVPGVRIQRGRVLEAEAPGARVWIDVDGEPLGVLPARFEIVPGAISFLGAGS
jgi:YegS/Rv2252/BmrU family lipid kinase